MTRQYNALVSASQSIHGLSTALPSVFSTTVSEHDVFLADLRRNRRNSVKLPAMWIIALLMVSFMAVATAVAQQPAMGTEEFGAIITESRGIAIEGWGTGGMVESRMTIERTMQYRDTGTIGKRRYDTLLVDTESNQVAAQGREFGGGVAIQVPISSGLDIRGSLGFVSRTVSLHEQGIDRMDPKLTGTMTAVDIAWSAASTQVVAGISLQVRVPKSGITMSLGPTARMTVTDTNKAPTMIYRDLRSRPAMSEKLDSLSRRERPMTAAPRAATTTTPIQWGIAGSLGYQVNLTDQLSLAPRLSVDLGLSPRNQGSWRQGREGGLGEDRTVAAVTSPSCVVSVSLGILYRL